MATRNFLTRSETDEQDAVVDAVAGRENELASYDANVNGYKNQLVKMDANLPAEWPAKLVKYKGKSNEQLFVLGANVPDALLVSKLNHRERVRMLLFTEMAEREKSEAAYEHCLTCLPKDEAIKSECIARYKARCEAQKARNQ